MQGHTLKTDLDWQTAETSTFWNKIADGEHVLHVYRDEKDLFHTLLTFTADGFTAGDSVIVIATPEHIQLLDEKLRSMGHNLFNLTLSDQYLPINASYALSEFMINGTPDPILFRIRTTQILKRARRNGQRVRVFGEMVSVLCERGNYEAAHSLEELWNELKKEQPLTLFCCYRMPDESQDPAQVANVYSKYQRHLHSEQRTPNRLVYRSL